MPKNVMQDLQKLVLPPRFPLDNDAEQLERNRQVMRIDFPADYLEFGTTYGTGTFRAAYSWEIWSPSRRGLPLIALYFSRTCNMYKESAYPKPPKLGVYPEMGGLLPFGSSPNGDWICWDTHGDSSEWTVVDLGRYEEGGYESTGFSFSEYLVNVLSQKYILERHRDGDLWEGEKIVFDQCAYSDGDFC